jgi:hypothetical protein
VILNEEEGENGSLDTIRLRCWDRASTLVLHGKIVPSCVRSRRDYRRVGTTLGYELSGANAGTVPSGRASKASMHSFG